MFIGLPIKLATTRVCVDVCPTTAGALLCVDGNGRQTAAPTGLDLLKMQDCYTATTTVNCCYVTYPTKESKKRPIHRIPVLTYIFFSALFKCVPDLGIGSPNFNSSTMGDAKAFNAALDFAANPAGAAGAAMGKIVQYWVVIAASVIVALVLGFIWLIFLRLFVGVMVWCTVVGLLLFLIILTIFAWEKAGLISIAKVSNQVTNTVGTSSVDTTQYTSQVTSGLEIDQTTAKVLASIISVVTIVYFLLFCVFMQRIRIAVQVIKEAAKAVGAMPFLVLYPLVTFISLLALAVWWVTVLLYLCSAGEFDPKTMSFTYPDTSTCSKQMMTTNALVQQVDADALCKLYKGNPTTAMSAWNPPTNARATVVGNSTALGITNKYKSQLPIQLNGSTYRFFLLFHLFGKIETSFRFFPLFWRVVAVGCFYVCLCF